jgi:hypothetical protein
VGCPTQRDEAAELLKKPLCQVRMDVINIYTFNCLDNLMIQHGVVTASTVIHLKQVVSKMRRSRLDVECTSWEVGSLDR